MREIKFRAWDKTYNIMQSTDDFVDEFITSKGEVIEVTEWSDYGGGGCNIDSIDHHRILMQYTGLSDKNGKEIYEGDILRTDLSRPYVVVVFRNGAFMYQCHDEGKDYFDFMVPSENETNQDEYLEVIGNIHENPELLGESK